MALSLGLQVSVSRKELENYGSRLRRTAAKSAANDQVVEIRKQQFRASLVDDPLKPSRSIAPAIGNARGRKPT